MRSRWRLDGVRALVTGGTKGIGFAIAQELVELGADVIVVARRTPSGTQDFVAGAQSGRLQAVIADVATAEGRARLVEALPAGWETLDVLVNNVGTNIRKASLSLSEDEFRTVFETNLTSAWELSRALHPRLVASGRASLVNIGSVAGMRSVGSGAAYAMSKAALAQLTRYLAVEWAADGIRVNMVSPWYTRTPLAAPVLDQPDF
jgi:tropinone reductase I